VGWALTGDGKPQAGPVASVQTRYLNSRAIDPLIGGHPLYI